MNNKAQVLAAMGGGQWSDEAEQNSAQLSHILARHALRRANG